MLYEQVIERGKARLTDTSAMSRSEWLKLRASGIGGSDAGAIMGLNKYATPLSVYFAKKDLAVHEGSKAAEWGNILEDPIRQKAREELGIQIETVPGMFTNKEHDFMNANFDGLIFVEGEKEIAGSVVSGLGGHEIKTSRTGDGFTTDEAEAITELYIAELVDAGVVKIVDRANFDKVMKELNFQSSDWSNSEKTAKLGQALNAKFISRGKIMKLGSKLAISASVIDIQTAENVASTKATYQDIDDLVSNLYELEITSLAKDVAYSRGPAGGLVFHFDGQYFYEAIFWNKLYSLKDANKIDVSGVRGYYDWKFPNVTEARYICENLLTRKKHDEILGDYWLYEYRKSVKFYAEYGRDYRIYDYNTENDKCRICLVRKFADE